MQNGCDQKYPENNYNLVQIYLIFFLQGIAAEKVWKLKQVKVHLIKGELGQWDDDYANREPIGAPDRKYRRPFVDGHVPFREYYVAEALAEYHRRLVDGGRRLAKVLERGKLKVDENKQEGDGNADQGGQEHKKVLAVFALFNAEYEVYEADKRQVARHKCLKPNAESERKFYCFIHECEKVVD